MPPEEDPGCATELTRPVLVRLNDDGSHSARSVLTPTDYKIRAELLIPSRLVVPIVFVPGIMGTRLRVTGKSKSAAWFPPEGTWEKLLAVLKGLGQKSSDRQRLLDPDTTEVDDNGPAHPDPETAVLMGDAKGDTDAERSKWRGWGQLHADSYAGILGLLEQRLAHILADGCNNQPQWVSAVMNWQDAAKLGAQKPFTALDDDALKLGASVFYPVHAVGYNWLQSNKASAEHLAAEIDRITGYYASRKKVCEQVIVVTHSMGGLVARACAQLPGMREKILGVVHGVMPATGAPATYKRMRAGFEGAASLVMGRDAADCTAVLANSPGGLELLPTRQYKRKDSDGILRHWLRASHHQPQAAGIPRENSSYFGADDFYADIYLNNSAPAWWRVVKEELIDPAGREEREKAETEGKQTVEENEKGTDFDKYGKVLDKAKELHDLIEDKYHPVTYAYYAADAQQRSWNEVHWKCSKSLTGEYLSAETVHDDLNGEVKIKLGAQTHAFTIQGPQGPGDGTVPEESGAAPTPHVVQIFRHEGQAKGHTSYEHQHSYGADVTQAVTLYSILRIVADSDWIKANLHKA